MPGGATSCGRRKIISSRTLLCVLVSRSLPALHACLIPTPWHRLSCSTLEAGGSDRRRSPRTRSFRPDTFPRVDRPACPLPAPRPHNARHRPAVDSRAAARSHCRTSCVRFPETPYTISKRMPGWSTPTATSRARSRGLIQFDNRHLSGGAGVTLPMRMQNTSIPYLCAYRLPTCSPNTLETP